MDKDKIKSLYILCGELSQQLKVEMMVKDGYLELLNTSHSNLNLFSKEISLTYELLKKTDEFLESIKNEVDLFDEL